MSISQHWRVPLATFAICVALAACGGGADSPTPISAPPGAPPAQEAGAPALTNNIATDGLNWINFRRAQVGMPVVTRNAMIDNAAQGHSDYQRVNNIVTHDQTAGKQGFTGVALDNRLLQAGYVFNRSANFAYGEVIAATTSASGVYMVEELITAIYHRFVMFEPRFKEIGTGSASNASGYVYLTVNFAANNGYGPGIGKGNLVTWPTNGQTGVTRNFLSDYEAPDPVPELNEVGYPVSVHADIDVTLVVGTFSMRPRGEADIAVKVLRRATDTYTPKSAAALVPLGVLRAATTYDVSFTGTADGVPISKNWSFVTK